jgi:UDP-glucose 4-epimerase
MKILVTGGAGFIGSHLVEHHLGKGDEVIAVDNCWSGSEDNIKPFLSNPQFTFYKTSFLEWPEKEAVLASVDRIYNMAAFVGMQNVLDHPLETLQVNCQICEQIFEAAAKRSDKPGIFVASSSEAYGPQDCALGENQQLLLDSVDKGQLTYPVSKIHNELIAKSYFKKFDVPCVIVRIFNTIGQRQTGFYGMVVPRLVKQAVKNEPITVFDDGDQTRAFCNARDSVVMFDQLMGCPEAQGEVVNVGHETTISINDLAQLVKKLAGSTSEIIHVPFEKAYRNSNEYIQIKNRWPLLDKLKGLIDVKYQWTLEKSIEDLIEQARQ